MLYLTNDPFLLLTYTGTVRITRIPLEKVKQLLQAEAWLNLIHAHGPLQVMEELLKTPITLYLANSDRNWQPYDKIICIQWAHTLFGHKMYTAGNPNSYDQLIGNKDKLFFTLAECLPAHPENGDDDFE